MTKATIFDVDGTLIDSVDYHAKAWQTVFRRYRIEASFDSVRDQIGKGGDKLMAVFLTPEQIDRDGKGLEEERSDLFKRQYLPHVRPFPNVRELFARIKSEGLKIALASSAKADELEIYKEITGVAPYLEAASSSDDASNSKPDPDVFNAALDDLKGIEASEVIAVGDTPYDAEAALKAGMRAIGVLCGGFAAEKLTAAGCMRLYRDPTDLLLHYDNSPLKQG